MQKHRAAASTDPIPVILDTDIGSDIDDTWALTLLLNSPEVDIRLITTTRGDTTYRARLVARLLEVAGRTDIPIGVGTPDEQEFPRSQEGWIYDYPLERYPGTVLKDGAGALIDVVRTSPRIPTLITIGPLGNVAEALRRDSAIAPLCRCVAMAGSVRRGLNNHPVPIAEYNIVNDITAAQLVFAAPWVSMTITPLDSCGLVRLKGNDYQAVVTSNAPLARAILANYKFWLESHRLPPAQFESASSVLYDTVAVHLAYTTRHLVMEDLRIKVDDVGRTVIDSAARPMQVATGWTDQTGFENELLERIIR